jgi:hypothetical protein
MNPKALLDAILYPPNVDIGGDTLVQVVVIARAVAEDVAGPGELLKGARKCVDLDRVAALVAESSGRLALTPELARTCVLADDERVHALAHRALGEAVGDEAEVAVEDIRADEGALVLVVGVLIHEAAAAPES